MTKKIFLKLAIVSILVFVLIWAISVVCSENKNCATIELRQQYLNELVDLRDVNIDTEIKIDDYIISGYTGANGMYGMAVFEPIGSGEYKFQSNANKDGSESLISTVSIHGVNYNLFWINKGNLDFAQVTYSTSDGIEEYKLDIENNEILYMQAPDKQYEVSVVFVAQSGEQYR